MGEKLRDILKRAQDALAKGNKIDEKDLEKMHKLYDVALNNSECPCESGKTFSNCCKMEWNALRRGIDRQRAEMAEAKRDAKRDEQPHGKEKEEGRDIDWVVRLGVDMKTGEPVIEPHDKWVGRHPYSWAGIILAAYHDVMTSATTHMLATVQQAAVQAMAKLESNVHKH